MSCGSAPPPLHYSHKTYIIGSNLTSLLSYIVLYTGNIHIHSLGYIHRLRIKPTMENISPEILHIVCSFLRVDDVLSFRLVGRSFADIGAAYMLPEVTFYMHDEELRRLREISLHPVFSRHVCSLTYFAHALDSPKVTFREFVRDHRRELRWNRRLRRRNLSTPQLMVEYRKYEEAADRQAAIMTAQTDIDVLKEVMPRFPNLQQMTMSAGHLGMSANIPFQAS